MAKIRHYKDTLTGQYVTRAKWARSKAHGGTRYRRVNEKYTKPTAPPKKKKIGGLPEPPVRTVERLKYISAYKKIDIEIVRVDGKVQSISVAKIRGHKRTYTAKRDIAKFSGVIHAAREQAALTKKERILEEIEEE